MKELLESKGWTMYYSCPTSCGGGKQYFNNAKFPSYQVRTRSKRNTFAIWNNNMMIAGPFSGYELGVKLAQYNLA